MRIPFRMPLQLTTLLLALVAAGAEAAAIDAAHSQIKFGFQQMKVAADGDFRKFSGDVVFDPATPNAAHATLTIDLAGIDAGSAEANDLLKTQDWFDVAHFPAATFTSTGFKPTGAGAYQVSGQFALKGKTGAIVIPFTTRTDAGGTWFEGSVPISRLAYKVGDGEWADVSTVADTVQIRFKLLVPRQ